MEAWLALHHVPNIKSTHGSLEQARNQEGEANTQAEVKTVVLVSSKWA